MPRAITTPHTAIVKADTTATTTTKEVTITTAADITAVTTTKEVTTTVAVSEAKTTVEEWDKNVSCRVPNA